MAPPPRAWLVARLVLNVLLLIERLVAPMVKIAPPLSAVFHASVHLVNGMTLLAPHTAPPPPASAAVPRNCVSITSKLGPADIPPPAPFATRLFWNNAPLIRDVAKKSALTPPPSYPAVLLKNWVPLILESPPACTPPPWTPARLSR